MSTLEFFKSYLKGKSKVITLISILVIISQTFSLAEAYMFKVVVDDYLNNILNIETSKFVWGVAQVTLVWVAFAFISRITKHVQMYNNKVLADTASIRLFEKAYNHTINLSLDYHEKKKTGEVLRQLSKARDDMSKMITDFFDQFLINIVSFVLVTIFYFFMQWQLAFVMIAFIPLFVGVTRYFSDNITSTQKIINNKMEHVHGSAQQAMDSITIVQSFNTQKLESKNMSINNDISHEAMKLKIAAWQKLSFWQGSLINLARLAVIGGGAYFVLQGSLTTGDVLMLSIWSFYVYQPMYRISELYATFKEGMDSIGRIQKLLDIQSSIETPKNAYNPKNVKGTVEFKDVVFHYEENESILKGINFEAYKGKNLAIVGPSGSGKSTITKLIARFYDIQKGNILIDGYDVKTWSLSALRNSIGIVMQEAILFNDSIYNNVQYGSKKTSKEAIVKAAKEAYAHDFIMKLPEGYNTVVGERGIKLSGGEKQRITIARTILKNPQILILDEATSALDSESEVIVQNALNAISANRTTITIAHRLSTIMNADEIIFLEKGIIQERGSHDELMKLGKKYKKYVDLQKKKEPGIIIK